MSVQTTYGYKTPSGVAGGLFDLSPVTVDSRLNAESVAGAVKFGMGVVQGATPGTNVKKPVAASALAQFEGIILTNERAEQTMSGEIAIAAKASLNILRYGRCWARLKDGITPAYGDVAYLITSGDNAGLFTVSTDSAETNKIVLNARYIGTKGTGNVAPVELYNQITIIPSAAVALTDLTDVDLSTAPTDGQALKYDGTATKWKATT